MISFKLYLENLDWNSKYPVASGTVDGRQVMGNAPNTASIESTFTNYTVLPGTREVPMADLGKPNSVFYAANDFQRSKDLAAEIQQSNAISPLIIAVDKEGPYILEGAHRFVALHYLNAKSFPAMVVIDND